jgi:hypothetical protein
LIAGGAVPQINRDSSQKFREPARQSASFTREVVAKSGGASARLDIAAPNPWHGYALSESAVRAKIMPVYSPIRRWMDSAEKARTAERLLALRRKLHAEITDRVGKDSLLVATWNLRDFDTNRLGHGPRLRESYYYIAEIISAFDLVTLQEVGRNLDALDALMAILGPEWDYFASAAVDIGSGREERMAFVFRQDKIRFRKIAGEIVLPGGQITAMRGGGPDPRKAGQLQFMRSP